MAQAFTNFQVLEVNRTIRNHKMVGLWLYLGYGITWWRRGQGTPDKLTPPEREGRLELGLPINEYKTTLDACLDLGTTGL